MLYLLHGENISASRQALVDLKKNYSADSVSVFDAKKFDADEFVRACETPSLLSDRRLLVVENKLPPATISRLFAPSDSSSANLIQFNNLTIYPSIDLVFWLSEELKPSNKLFKLVKEAGGQIRRFRPTIPKHVFGFLDALGYKNKQKALLELHRLLDQGESPIYLLTMIVWQVRNLLSVKLAANGGPKPKMAPFVWRKTQGQVKNFREEEIVKAFRSLLDAEIQLKTSSIDPMLVLDRVVDKLAT
jgi:DNA polymerase III delta subunit